MKEDLTTKGTKKHEKNNIVKNLKHSKKEIEIKERMRLLWLGGEKDPQVLAVMAQRAQSTVYRWMKEWERKYSDQTKLLEEIKVNVGKALNEALKRFSENPEDAPALQSVVSLLKQFQQSNEPSKQWNDHLIKFLDLEVMYCIETNNDVLLKAFQPEVEDLAEYIRRKNNG